MVDRRTRLLGVVLCLTAGLAFAIQPILGQLAFDGGASLAPLLGWRYAIAALLLGVLARRRLARLPLRVSAAAFALGVVLYAADSAFFYAALERTSAPFASLLHYAYLLVVVAAAALLGRERLQTRRVAAVVAVLVGVALVGGGAGSPDVLGIVLALASALACAGYVLVSDLFRGVDPVAFTALLVMGAATAFLGFGTFTGALLTVGDARGVTAIVVGALVGTAFAMSAFLAGIRLLGPGTASLLATVEVPVGLGLSTVVLGERLAAPQLVGAALVVGAIVLLQVRLRLPRRRLAAVHSRPAPAGPEPVSAAVAA